MILFSVTTLLLSIVDYATPPLYARAQISSAPAETTAAAASSTTSCQKFPIAGITNSPNSLMAANVLDNNLNTAWSSNAIGSWIQADLGGQKNICSLDLAWYHGNELKYNFVIAVSNDGTAFKNVFTSDSNGQNPSFETYFLHGGTAGRYVRITVNGNNNNNDNVNRLAGIAELAVYGYGNAPSPAPTAEDKNVQTNAGAPVQITLTGNDPISADALKFSVVSLPQHGSLAQGTMPNSVICTPNRGFSGTDSFTYKATDSRGVDSNIATVTMKISASSSSPSATNSVTIQTTSSPNVWSGYSSLSGNVPGDPASARNSDGRLEVFVVQSDHALYHKSETVAGSSIVWTSYSSLGGYVISNPIVARNSDGRLEVFVIGADHAVWHKSQITAGSSSWSGYSSLGGNFIGNPAAARNSDGRLEVFVIGADHALYHNFQTTAGSTTSWSGFTKLGGYIIGNPTAGLNGDRRVEVFVIGSNHALYHIFEQAPSSSNSWSGFSGLGGYIISDPVVASNSDSRLEVFVIGSNHALYHIFEQASSSSNSWSGYAYLGGSILSNTNPAGALNSQGQLQVFVVAAANNAIIYKFQATPGSSSWTGYVGLGGFVISNPLVAVNSDGRLELFVIGKDHALYHDYQLSATDKFGIKELYPSKTNGEQWYINMQNPTSDAQFNPNGVTLTRNADGSHKVQSSQVRLLAYTSSGYHQNLITTYDQQALAQKGYMQSLNDWKNVEITGYMKVNHFTTSTTNGAAHISLSARGGTHSSTVPCEGTAYWSGTYETGTAQFKKELEHTSGYTTNNPQISGATGALQGKWIGVKAVYYTFQNGSVELEQWLDDKSDNINSPGNNWHKVLQFKDIGNWGGGINDCGGTPTTIITWGGPIIQFRWDNIDDMDIKDLSVRELQPPQ